MLSTSLLALLVTVAGDAPPDPRVSAIELMNALSRLVVERRESELGLTNWAYECSDAAACAGTCTETLKAIGGSLASLDPGSLCDDFKQAVNWSSREDSDPLNSRAIAWVRRRFQRAALNAEANLGEDDRVILKCNLARLSLGGDARGCARADALSAAATISRLADYPEDAGDDRMWSRLCFELDSCAKDCAFLLNALTGIDPREAGKLPLCPDARASLGGAKPDAEKLFRFGKQRVVAFLQGAVKSIGPERGPRLRCDAARLGLLATDPACPPEPDAISGAPVRPWPGPRRGPMSPLLRRR